MSFAPRHIVVTGCDAAHFELAEDLIASIRAVADKQTAIGFIRFCNTELPSGIASAVDEVVDCSAEYGLFNAENGYYAAFVAAKPRIPSMFPGFEIYTWIDADCWLQNDVTLRRVERMALAYEICIHPEYDIHYMRSPTPSARTQRFYGESMPKDVDQKLARLPMLNSGVTSARRESRVWELWENALRELRARVERGEAKFYSDQIPLHYIIHTQNLSLYPLRATDNWQTYARAPRIDLGSRKLTTPTFPFEEISTIHLASWTKDAPFLLDTGETVRLRRREFLAFVERLSAATTVAGVRG